MNDNKMLIYKKQRNYKNSFCFTFFKKSLQNRQIMMDLDESYDNVSMQLEIYKPIWSTKRDGILKQKWRTLFQHRFF